MEGGYFLTQIFKEDSKFLYEFLNIQSENKIR